jgi:hypothetical protein
MGCEIFGEYGESRVLLRLAHGIREVDRWANGLYDRVETWMETWMENENIQEPWGGFYFATL